MGYPVGETLNPTSNTLVVAGYSSVGYMAPSGHDLGPAWVLSPAPVDETP